MGPPSPHPAVRTAGHGVQATLVELREVSRTPANSRVAVHLVHVTPRAGGWFLNTPSSI